MRGRFEAVTRGLDEPDARPPEKGLPDAERAINRQRDLINEQLQEPLSADACEHAEDLLGKLLELVRAATEERDDLGGDSGALIAAFGGDEGAIAKADQAFGGRDKLRAACKAFGSPATLATLATSLGGGDLDTGAGILQALHGPFGTDGVVAAHKALGGERLAALLTAAGDAAKLHDARDALGDSGLDALVPSAGDAAVPFAIIDKVGGAGAMKTLAAETGLGEKPKAMAAMFTKGCSGDPQVFADTLAAFGSDEERGRLKGILVDGGLGDAPDCFGALLAEGCGKRPEALKAFSTSFAGAEARAGLKRMLTDGGLSGKTSIDGTVEIDPKCLSGLLKHAAGATKPDDPADDAKRGDVLARLFRELDSTDCGRLSDVMAKGGLGTEPDVLGHLIGVGCVDGGNTLDPAKVKALGAAFQEPSTAPTPLPASWPPLTALKDLVRKGGFGTKDPSDVDTNTDPRCLGAMLRTGCEGDPRDLVTLTTALGDQDRTNLATVLKNGDMGTHPQVLANTYKFGCLNDPYDPTSAKQPNHLKTLASTFGTSTNAPKLKNLLVDGGLGDDTNHPEWLGKLMRDGFTQRHYVPAVAPPTPPPRPAPGIPSGISQDPAKLLDLHDAFTGDMPKLKNMIDAMGSMPPSCGLSDEPGKALQNIVNPGGALGGVPINQLQTFYDTLDSRSGGPQGTSMGPGGTTVGIAVPGGFAPAVSLSGVELIQQAASMEWESVVAPTVSISGYNTDVDHVMRRHNRTAPVRQANGNNNTSMLPKSVTEEDVRQIIAKCIADSSLGKANPKQLPPPHGTQHAATVPANNPPQLPSDLYNSQRQYLNVVGGGYTGTIGYKRQGVGVVVGQFYPTAGPDVVALNALDLDAIKRALGK